ncbi:hypothetical protein [Cryobacterium sp. TMB1-7]|uniref:hypothetical protein n=1 Tax=Cryobacterium sp. TMB1-7 TaxID=2555866 RepID=UPI00106B2667|nr:hypothetical protein [Cryobacterium sp. TMB1-7]TFC63077.1 hypothetical protein E3O60_00690 [Cryobacterium sp. TMB1-7]
MNDSTDDAEARIRALGHVRVSAGAHDATQALTTLLEDPEIRAASEPARRRRFAGFTRRHRLVIGSLIALVGVGVAIPAVGNSLHARTGVFGDPSKSTEVDDTEWIDPGADDAGQVVLDAYPDYLTLPPGMPKNAAIADVSRWMAKVTAGGGAGESLMQEGLIIQIYEFFGMCAWTDVWLSAEASGDESIQALATAWIADPDNYRQFMGVAAPSAFDRMTDVAAAAAAGEPQLVEETYAENDCAVRMDRIKR